MFKENDKCLRFAPIIINAFAVIEFVSFIIVGILLARISLVYLLIIPIGFLFDWVAAVFAHLFVSYLCDVKLIRNKLYNEQNDNIFAVFGKSKEKNCEQFCEAKLISNEEDENDEIR